MDLERPKSKQPIPENAKLVHKGVIFDVYQWEQEMYDGTKKTFELLRRPDTVVVFGVLPDGKILLTEQEQPHKLEPYFAAAGGRVDKGEEALAAAKRELLEETGYEAEEFILWDAQYPVGKIDWVVFTFVAKGLKKVKDMELDGGEKVKLMPVTFDEFLELPFKKGSFFAEQEILLKLLEAKLDPVKRKELEELFKPKEILS